MHVRIFISHRVIFFTPYPCHTTQFSLSCCSRAGDAIPHILVRLDSISSVCDQVLFLRSAPASYSLPPGLAALHPNSFPQQAALQAIYFHAGFFTFIISFHTAVLGAFRTKTLFVSNFVAILWEEDLYECDDYFWERKGFLRLSGCGPLVKKWYIWISFTDLEPSVSCLLSVSKYSITAFCLFVSICNKG